MDRKKAILDESSKKVTLPTVLINSAQKSKLDNVTGSWNKVYVSSNMKTTLG